MSDQEKQAILWFILNKLQEADILPARPFDILSYYIDHKDEINVDQIIAEQTATSRAILQKQIDDAQQALANLPS